MIDEEHVARLREIYDRYAFNRKVVYAFIGGGGQQVGGMADERVMDFAMFLIAAQDVLRLPARATDSRGDDNG